MFLRSMYIFIAVLHVRASMAEDVPQTYNNLEQVYTKEVLYEADQLHTVHIFTQAFWNDSKMTVSVSDGIDNVVISWTFQGNRSDLTGFFLTYHNDKKEHFDSPVLEKTLRQFSLPSLDKELQYTICVHALMNSTEVQHACTSYNENSLKIVVGIMAGVVFLIPCVLALVWLFRKDKSMTSDFERLLGSSSYNGIISVVIDTQDQNSLGYTNGGYTKNDQLESQQKDSGAVIANTESPQRDSSTVIAGIEPQQKNASAVIANIESPQSDSSTVIASIEPQQKNASVFIANIESPQRDSSTVIANIESPQKNASAVIANIESPPKNAGTVIANIESPQKNASTATANIEPPQKNASTVTARTEPPHKNASTVIANTESPQKD